MQWAVGTIAAPRPVHGGLKVTVNSLRANGWDPIVFAEPETEDPADVVCLRINRPQTLAPIHRSFEVSPAGVFGNFQNYIQAAMDLLHQRPNADAYLITEDDVQFSTGIREWIEPRLWNDPLCGCWSLYTANTPQHRHFHFKEMVSPKTPIMGSLALIWKPEALRAVIESDAVSEWPGSSSQSLKRTPRWMRLAVDTFLGFQLRAAGYHLRLFSRSFVRHWHPQGFVSNSACGNGAATGKRKELDWIGENPDIHALFPRKRR